ncbi:MAG: phosphoribosyltransferase family protein [Candidatus Aenigmatarchaeota archaeon]
MFRDRTEAGKRLAEILTKFKNENPIILAIPRGGVVVADEIAKNLNANLDIIVPRKIGAPGNPELAIGAVAQDGSLYIDENLVKDLGVSENYIKKEMKKELQEIERRLKKYRKRKKYPSFKNKTLILVDDGIATGATMKAAIQFLKKQNPKKIIVAVPVAPRDTVNELEKIVDEVIVVEKPIFMGAIGEFYVDFRQVEDEEVINILKKYYGN